MKYLASLFLMIFVSSCNITDNKESSPSIKSGIYELQAQRTTAGEKTVSAGRIGDGYYSKQFQFFEDDSIQIEIKSDIVNENGSAKGTYQMQNSKLITTITTSTTDRYNGGEQIMFSSFRVVDESFAQTFQSNGETFTFKGPGLLLEQQHADQQDLDEDGNSSETLTQTNFYSRLVRYDEDGK